MIHIQQPHTISATKQIQTPLNKEQTTTPDGQLSAFRYAAQRHFQCCIFDR
jgi:hypothetical protein